MGPLRYCRLRASSYVHHPTTLSDNSHHLRMRHRRFGVVVLALLSTVVQLPSRLDAQGRKHAVVEGELVVQYRPGSDATAHARARGRAKAQMKQRHRIARGRADEAVVDVLTVPADHTAAAIAALESDPAVEHVEPNLIYRHSATPNDPYFGQLWGLNNTGQPIGGASGIADADTDTLEAWSRGIGSPQVYVAVLDQGIDIAHEDLGADPYGPIWTNAFDRRDGIDNDGNGYVDDVNGFDFFANDNTVYDGSASALWMDAHGTHVAGTIGARPNNGIGIAGVNWDVRIIPAKFMGPDGGTLDAAVRAIDYIVDLKTRHGLNIVAINASWGSHSFSQILLEAIARAAREDIVFVAAAGNGGTDDLGDNNDQLPEYPASYDTSVLAGWDSVIAVAATGPWDDLPGFSNYGERSVDLGAPGVSILSTTPGSRYGYSNGTSMATPHVTGAAALVSAATGLTGRALRARLLASVDRRPSLNGRTSTGGRLNVHAAFAAAVVSPSTLPSPWQGRDIGAVGAAGTAGASGGTFRVSGAGADVWDSADAFHFAFQNLTGDGSITARVASVQTVHAWTKVGVMIRASLSPASAHGFMLVSPGKGVAFQRRQSDGAVSLHTAGSSSVAPRWVRVTRSGSTVLGFESADGASWTLVGSSSIALGTTAMVGLAVSSHVAGTPAEATFDNVTVKSIATTAAWANGDVGPVGQAGSASITGNSMAVAGSGFDIWGTSDQFHFVYQPFNGDGSIVARVTNIDNSHVWVKAGVMIRETLSADSAQAMMLVTPGGTKGLAFQRRVATGGISTNTSGGGGTSPAWIRLVRTGNTITASRSHDGVTWTVVGSDTFAMGQTVYVGVAVTSHDNAVLATATFDNVAVSR